MQQFYIPSLCATSTDVFFDRDESRHLAKVLRKNIGDIVSITNGLGYRFTAELTQVDSKTCVAVIVRCEKIASDPYHLHIFIAPTKNKDRIEWFVEKATEIGVHAITPIICQRSERKTLNTDRLRKVSIAAMKQSMGAHATVIHPISDFTSALDRFDGVAYIAHCEDSPKKKINHDMVSKKSISIFIGPEGDFTALEIQTALDANVMAISLGKKRLRTETAGISACHSIALLFD
jgi:16S rRNA (uracil1498-N3)-methyltransferase